MMESVYVCSKCRHQSATDLARCPACGGGPFYATVLPGRAGGARAGQGAAAGGAARACYKCDYEVSDDSVKVCPRCGRGRVLTPRQVRALGWVLLAMGAFLVAFMGAITYVVAGIVANSDRAGTGARFTGDSKQAAIMFGLFGLVIAFGVASVVAGTSQVIRGRRSAALVKVIMGIFIALIVVGELVFIYF